MDKKKQNKIIKWEVFDPQHDSMSKYIYSSRNSFGVAERYVRENISWDSLAFYVDVWVRKNKTDEWEKFVVQIDRIIKFTAFLRRDNNEQFETIKLDRTD